MPKIDKSYQHERDEFVLSLIASREDGLRHGPVSANDANRSGDEAIARGLRRREARLNRDVAEAKVGEPKVGSR